MCSGHTYVFGAQKLPYVFFVILRVETHFFDFDGLSWQMKIKQGQIIFDPINLYANREVILATVGINKNTRAVVTQAPTRNKRFKQRFANARLFSYQCKRY